jgi:anti-sigma regulatory factor (Ser/Thr protein kinase)
MTAESEPGVRSVVESIVVDANPQSVRTVRSIARNHARAMSMPLVVAADVELAISELVTNALEHGAGEAINVTISRTDFALLLTVKSHLPPEVELHQAGAPKTLLRPVLGPVLGPGLAVAPVLVLKPVTPPGAHPVSIAGVQLAIGANPTIELPASDVVAPLADSETPVAVVPLVEPDSRAGRGLRIVSSIADEVTVNADGSILTVSCLFVVPR